MADISKDINYFVTSIVSVATLFTTWRTLRTQYRIYKKKKEINHIQNKELLGVQELQQKIKKNNGKQIHQTVLVQGKIGVDSSHQIVHKSTATKKQSLALLLTWKQAIYSNDSFDIKKNNYVLNMKQVLKNCKIQGGSKIYIVPQNLNQNNKISLKNLDQKDYSKILQILDWQEKKQKLTISQDIQVIFLSILRALLSAGSDDQGQSIRGIQIGNRTVKAGIKIGATATILGTLKVSLEGDNIIQIQSIFKDRLSELTQLRSQVDNLISQRNIWLIGALVGTIYLGRRAFKYCRQKGIKIPFIDN